jgi:hypothetical protein
MNMSIIKKCKFLFRKKDEGWNKLIDLLKRYIEELATLGPTFELQRMQKGEYDMLRKMDLEQLRARTEAAAYEARHTPPGIEIGDRYHNISLAANFSAVVKYERQHAAIKFNMRDFRIDPSYILPSSETSTMALLFDYPVKKEHRVVLIEWMDEMDHDQERGTRVKTLMLATPKPGQLLLPTCYGMVEDTAMRRFGLVLAPPAHIRSNLPSILPSGAISQKRMPVSLKELLDRRHPACVHMLDLGIRFRLAKKLVNAVHMMHCVGWIHKYVIDSLLRNTKANTQQEYSLKFHPLLSRSEYSLQRPPWPSIRLPPTDRLRPPTFHRPFQLSHRRYHRRSKGIPFRVFRGRYVPFHGPATDATQTSERRYT